MKPQSALAVRVYSYTRFSRPEQKEGDSQRRQDDDAQAWCDRNGHLLDDKLKLRDEGRSAFHGHHRTKGRLGQFLKAVEDGKVPKGSILLVENIDRLGREGPQTTLREIIFKLWDEGVIIQTLSPVESYKPNCDSTPQFLALLIYLQRAWDESQQKSKRLKAARNSERAKARTENRTLSRMVPLWIKVTPEGERIVIPEAAKAIRQLFKLKLQGMGAERIARKLNQGDGWKPPKQQNRQSGGWRQSYVKKILSYRAVLGEHQPHLIVGGRNGKRIPDGDPIPNYYPPIIKPDVFYAVQEKLKANRGKGGQTGKFGNLLRDLVKCAYCGGVMRFVDKSNGNIYLVCDNAKRGLGCSYDSIRYEESEKVVLANCHGLNPGDVLPDEAEQTKTCQRLRERIAGKQAQIKALAEEIENFDDQVGRSRDATARDRFESKSRKRSLEKLNLETEVASDEQELAKAELSAESFATWKKDFDTLQANLSDPDLRSRLNSHLRDLIDKIEVFGRGHAKLARYNRKLWMRT
jgi:DNA invertase Pin-like site-specific DNA recombinase